MAITSDGESSPAGSRAYCASDIKPPRNKTKARVTRGMRGGRAVVVKDCSFCSPWVKASYGRPCLRREARAYGLLQGVAGIPECLGLEGRDALIIEYIHGRLLSDFKRGNVDPGIFDRIDEIVACAHERGVALVDLHRSNIIITAAGEVYLFDFALAVIARNSSRPGMLARIFMEFDCHAARRMRARYLLLPEPVPKGLFAIFYRLGRGLKAFRRILKKH